MRYFQVFLFGLFLHLSSFAWSQSCEQFLEVSFLKKEAGGEFIGELEMGSVGGEPVMVRDVTKYVHPVSLPDKPDIAVVSLSDVFEDVPTYIGFGYPNVYLIHPTEEGNKRFAAKSLYRQDSKVESLSQRNSVQGGLWITLPDLTAEQQKLLLEAAESLEGTRRITCSSAVCEVLHTAGFKLGDGQDLYKEPKGKRIFPKGNDWPFLLLRSIARHGLKHGDEDVKVEFIKVSPGFVEKVFTGNLFATIMTPWRHAQRAWSGLKNRLPGVKYFIARKEGNASVVAIQYDQVTRENVKLARSAAPNKNYSISVTRPSKIGHLLRLLWGEHSIIKMSVKENATVSPLDYLSEPLKEYPDLVPDNFHYEANIKSRSITALKRALFNPGTIKLIHRFMSPSEKGFEGVDLKSVYDMFPVSTEDAPNKMNIVITAKDIRVMHMKGVKAWADWWLTKHVLIADYADDVLFAGEIWKAADGTIYVNNNSGTYKPSEEQLKKALELLRQSFPGVVFEAAM